MLTAGVDLSSQPAHTAICAIEWRQGHAVVTCLTSDVTDHKIVELMALTDKVGLDVPFGWPMAFAEALSRHSLDGSWSVEYDHCDGARSCQ